jgi:nucleoside-diphosphate-sugar epimerase
MGDQELVIVTGSRGRTGAPLCERLAGRYDVVGFDRASPHPAPAVPGVEADLSSDASVAEALARVRREYGRHIASVVHLAPHRDLSGEADPRDEEAAVAGCRRLLRGLQDFIVEQVVLVSSMLVHAPTVPGRPLAEHWPLQPKWALPRALAGAEDAVRTARGAATSVLLRSALVYDDGCHSFPLAHQIQRIEERGFTSRVFPGDLTHGQAYLHNDDLVEALSRVIDRRALLPVETTLLVGQPETASYDTLQHAICRALHHEEWETWEMPKAVAKAGAWVHDRLPTRDPSFKPWMIDIADDHYELDIALARRLLGWEPRRRLLDDIPRLIEVMRADPEGWCRENGLAVHHAEESASSA